MLALLLAASVLQQPNFDIVRDSYGVPKVSSLVPFGAYRGAGYAVAQDRLWQMEQSRRLAEGRMAEAFGSGFLSADRETARLGYTAAEIDAQIAKLDSTSNSILSAYAQGINQWIKEASLSGKLPPGYSTNDLKPEPWTVHDSAAIAINLFQRFGRGGAGELRTLALIDYLKARPQTSKRYLDVVDDLAWQQDPAAIPTVSDKDDPVKAKPVFPSATRQQTIDQFKSLPTASLFELLPGLGLAEKQETKLIAERAGAPFYTGSYCVVIGPKKSANGKPMLLSGPQMGFSNPSIGHEISLREDGLNVTGLDVPGIPGVLVGTTLDATWGITSGVADVEDIFAFHSPDADHYIYEGKTLPYKTVEWDLKVKGGETQIIKQKRTLFGPVLVSNKAGCYALRTAFQGRELEGLPVLYHLYSAKTASDFDSSLSKNPMSYNVFYALKNGDFGWRYTGLVPVRNPHLDPRLPTPATVENDWKGLIPAASMPHVLNPSAGYLANWNNKPASWWSNGDTPVWGSIFRNSLILDHLSKPKMTMYDLEQIPFFIARHDEVWSALKPYLSGVGWAAGFEGELVDGSFSSSAWVAFEKALRQEIFLGTTGNFLSDSTFNLVVQPPVWLKALQGKTKFPYLGSRSAKDVVAAAVKAAGSPGRYRANTISVVGQVGIPYSNRGTYIQLVELDPEGNWSSRTVLPPGESESGDHFQDQVPLSRAWTYKPSWVGR